ncbi:CDP-glycerol glycerophosphotransferase family protein [Lysobacter korlensis]|uniref:CDP-glycerol glycerophosphotransferase family protein n=1 Tax=Lysobacter korlensis TaxID=553636 RepID=A0ABV6RZI4_9GAMM
MTQVLEAVRRPDTASRGAVRDSFRKSFRSAGGRGLIVNALGVLTLFLAIARSPFPVVLAVGVLTLCLSVRTFARLRPRSAVLGTYVLARTLLVFAVAALPTPEEPYPWWLGVACAVLALTTIGEITVIRVLRAATPRANNIPGVEMPRPTALRRGWLSVCNVLTLAALPLVGFAVPSWGVVWVAAPSVVVATVLLLDATKRIRARRSGEQRLVASLAAYAPVFAVHWDAPREESFQLSMWLPYLERLGVPFLIIVRNPATFAFASRHTDKPVVLCRQLSELDPLVVPSLKTAFYVNNNSRNQHFVRYTHLTHIHLNHGESDKAPSYSPLFRLFDKNFVAGQAAIDRFSANGVWMRPEAFAIVGRPQVESIEVESAFIGSKRAKTVMYAPTWSGLYADSRYSSLLIGVPIVQALVERGCTVLFRPHPYTRRNHELAREAARIKALLEQDRARSGRRHVTGRHEKPEPIADWFNESDALIADVSSVVPDFLYSEKPFALTAMLGPLESFASSFPISRGSYLIHPDLGNLQDALEALLETDPGREGRKALKKYYLGDFPHEGYADVFLAEARKYL